VSNVSRWLVGRRGRPGFVSNIGDETLEKMNQQETRTNSWRGGVGLMSSVILITDNISLEVPVEQALAVIQDLNRLAQYEPKVEAVYIRPKANTDGTYTARGHFAGLLWRGRFSYQLRPQGFHSEMISGPPGVQVSGGFVVRSEEQYRCCVTHYERYQLSWWLWPFAFLLRLYLMQAMKDELRTLAQLIQVGAATTERRGLMKLL
jgi:hypothetical protein